VRRFPVPLPISCFLFFYRASSIKNSPARRLGRLPLPSLGSFQNLPLVPPLTFSGFPPRKTQPFLSVVSRHKTASFLLNLLWFLFSLHHFPLRFFSLAGLAHLLPYPPLLVPRVPPFPHIWIHEKAFFSAQKRIPQVFTHSPCPALPPPPRPGFADQVPLPDKC